MQKAPCRADILWHVHLHLCMCTKQKHSKLDILGRYIERETHTYLKQK